MSAEQIRKRLSEALHPEVIEVQDNSQAHAGHTDVQQSGGGHYHVCIVARDFAGKTQVQRHQLVYRALGEMMKNQIHALGIDAFTPEEYNLRK